MAFGDVLAGYEQASHQHNVNLLQMDYENRRTAAQMFGKMADSPNYTPEQRAWFGQAALAHLNFHEKVPKEYDVSKGEIKIPIGLAASKQEQPGAMPMGTPGAPLGMPAPDIEPPSPPQRNVMQPRSVDEMLQQKGEEERQAGSIKTDVAIDQSKRIADYLKQTYPELSDVGAASMSLGHPAPQQSFGVTGTVSGDDASALSSTDAGGQPTDPSKHYNVRYVNGKAQLTPVEAKSTSLRFAETQDGHWVGYTTDQFGKVNVQRDLGLTPPQGIPTDSIQHGIRIVQQPDGSFQEVPVTTSTSRFKSGINAGTGADVGAPTPPQAQGATAVKPPTGAGIGSKMLAAPTTPTSTPTATPKQSGTGIQQLGPKVGGRALSPEQMMQTSAKATAFDNMIDRMTGVLEKADMLDNMWKAGKIKLATDPQHPWGLVVARGTGLTPEEASFAGDYLSLGEDINLLRGVFQATGFRGPEAFATQQAQRGPLLGDPSVFKKVLSNSLKASVDQLKTINTALTRAGQPLQVSTGIKKAYMFLNNNNPTKAAENAIRDGWQF